MHPDLERLKELERVDAEIARLKEEISALPKRVAAIEEQLSGIRAHIVQVQAAQKNNDSQRRKLEADIQAQQGKISKYREQSLDVKTNEQYKALMTEIQYAEKAVRDSEDKILEIMMDNEARDQELKTAQAEEKKQAAAVEVEKNDARARTAEDEKLLADAAARRAELRRGISGETVALYDRVARQRKNVIVEAREQKCSACFVMLRPQKYQEIRTNEQLLTCDSCGRILFYDPAHEPPPPAPKPRRKKDQAGVEAEDAGVSADAPAGA